FVIRSNLEPPSRSECRGAGQRPPGGLATVCRSMRGGGREGWVHWWVAGSGLEGVVVWGLGLVVGRGSKRGSWSGDRRRGHRVRAGAGGAGDRTASATG